MNNFLTTGLIAVPLSVLFSYLILRLFGITAKKSTVSSEAELDLNKFALFTMELAFMLHTKSPISEAVLETLMKMRTNELKEMVLDNLKDFPFSPEGPKFVQVDNSEIQNKINDMLMNFETYVDNYMKRKYH